jgi:MoaA/NifB/PqqE/SkfB family radical SAM enzyme
VDNTGDRFELERSGCTWDQLNNTVKNFVASSRQNPSLKIGINVTVSIQNVLYLPEMIEWINQSGIDHYSFSLLSQPQYLSIKNITKSAKELILHKLTTADLMPADQANLNFIIGEVMQAPTSDGQEFCNYMKQKDQLRKENFGETHAEIAQAMGY